MTFLQGTVSHTSERSGSATTAWIRSIPFVLVFLATTFNGILSLLNSHGLRANQTTVILAEVSLVAASNLFCLYRYRNQMLRWYVFMAAFVMIAVTRALLTGDPNVKYLRDILIIPTFILLGLSCDRRYLVRFVCITHLFVIGIALYEAISPASYGTLFGVQSYYINTRNYSDDNFWNKGSDLFVNAERPQDRIFLPQLSLHREASIFLEPVSLGNYCVIVMAFLCAFYGKLSPKITSFLLLGTVALIIACDGRIAFATSFGIIVLAFISPYLPKRSSIVTMPILVMAAFVVVAIGNYTAGGDDFGSRLSTTTDLLKGFGFSEYFGLSDNLVGSAADSGIAYLILTQSLFGTMFIWIFLATATTEVTVPQIRYNHAVALYLASTLMVSFSVFTIKTAAVLWFIFGAIQQPSVAKDRRKLPR